MKIAVDFISCQCVRNALETTNELRGLSSTHENREDKLQLKSHIYHTGKFYYNAICIKEILKEIENSDQTLSHFTIYRYKRQSFVNYCSKTHQS